MRIFLDANILFSAAKSDGAIRRLLRLLEEAGHECWADGYVVEEARRNLAAKLAGGLGELEAVLARTRIAPSLTSASSIATAGACARSRPRPKIRRP